MEKTKTIKIFNIIAVISIIIFCVAISPVSLQNDTFYSIAIGKHILQNGIDMQDPFSWNDLPYTYPHWLYDVCTYLIYSPFGMTGIYVATCILAAVLGIAMYFVNCKLAKNHAISFIVTIASIYLLKDYIAARAQLVTFILFILEIFLIEKFIQTRKIRYAIGLIAIATAIANLHAAVWPFFFVLFLPYIAEYVVALITDVIMDKKIHVKILEDRIRTLARREGNEEKISKLKIKLAELNIQIQKSKEKRAEAKKHPYKLNIVKDKNVKWLIVVMLICVLTGLLTPIGDTPYTYLIKTMQGTTTQNINEHLPMTLIEHQYILCLLVVYLAMLIFTKVKIRLRDLFMICGLAFLMLSSRRQATMFVLIGSVILNRLTYETLEIYYPGSVKKLAQVITTKVGAFVTIGIILAISLSFINQKKDDHFVDEKTYPVQACDYILNNIDLKTARFYNDYNYGSYMLFRGIPVFIDSRADLYAPEFNTKTGNPADGKDIFMDFINVSSIATYYDTIFEKYNMTHVITTKKSKLAMLIDNRNDDKYMKLYSDEYFVIYVIQDE